uniref:Vesicle transport v-SNARE N-terminal domain-containing protein n=1 Tax=Trieres chinensis TaxID=1514140 RepID=A0A7S1ZY98_TRICV|mmetsp:Transcript_35170/g.72016  ORF Transcript_35170/g.72016 Transcript_35170/m.72016 type:complete len:191 (+) Transcript_35170:105-677(+)
MDVKFWDGALVGSIGEIRELLDVESRSKQPKTHEPVLLLEKLQYAEHACENYRKEVRLLQGPSKSREVERLKAHRRALEDLAVKVRKLTSTDTQSHVFSNKENQKKISPAHGEDIRRHASYLQDQTKQSIRRTMQMAQECKSIGTKSLGELREQREILERCEREAFRSKKGILKANGLLRRFKRAKALGI